MNWSVANGGQLIDVENKKGSWNTPEFIEGQQFAVDMICQDGCMMNVDDYQGLGQALGMYPWAAGVQGIASRGSGYWVSRSEADLTQVAWVRSPNTGESAGLGSMHFHIVTTQSQHPAEAFEFITYLANFENQKNIALSGTAEPINAGVWQDADYQATWGGPEAVEALSRCPRQLHLHAAAPWRPRMVRRDQDPLGRSAALRCQASKTRSSSSTRRPTKSWRRIPDRSQRA